MPSPPSWRRWPLAHATAVVTRGCGLLAGGGPGRTCRGRDERRGREGRARHVHPGAVHSKAHERLELAASFFHGERAPAGIVHHVIMTVISNGEDRDRAADLIARKSQEQVRIPEP